MKARFLPFMLPFLLLGGSFCGARSPGKISGATGPAASPASGPTRTVAAEHEAVEKELPANRLATESSPYLLLHAHNPVDWYPWGEEAIEKARREEKPIFLSVGYSTCYWCHVMEREVFSDPAIARLMNDWFVSIKVDREERPDIDEIYMTATQLLTRSGGWPNSVFLTPELKPFFAGTYFPPEDRDGRPGFPTVLKGLHEAWASRRSEVEASSEKVASAIRQTIAERRQPVAAVVSAESVQRVVAYLKSRYDKRYGGFGGPPKFPSPANLFLLWAAGEKGDAEAREMVLHTLREMGRGAIYDQLEGGFHRYTLDIAWRIPHFEKMLYDNAHLAELAALAWEKTRDPEFERLCRGTLNFVFARMKGQNGAFLSAIDAETDGVEGAYYTWTQAELREVLGPEGFRFLAPIFGFDGSPTLEAEKYTLFLTKSLAANAADLKKTREELVKKLEPHLESLRRARARREFPLIDDKALTDWNGMMIAAMARAGRIFGEPRYLFAAQRSADFLLENVDRKTGTLLHAWRGGYGKIPAFLDDYAFFVRGLLLLEEATGERRWLEEAVRLTEEMEARLRDPQGGYYFAEENPSLLFQPKTATDGAIPSGNGIAILNLLALAERTGQAAYRRAAEEAIQVFSGDMDQYPGAFATLALALRSYQAGREGGETRTTSTRSSAEGIEELARSVVEAQARFAGPPRGSAWRSWELRLALRPGWHVNANPASLDFLVPTEVSGEVRNVAYPAGEKLKFEFARESLSVYSGKALFRGEAKGPTESLRLTYQACDDRRCLPAVTREVKIQEERARSR